jgi:hypothetical protein
LAAFFFAWVGQAVLDLGELFLDLGVELLD